jgi:pimeloyl-ACP methyl ester carboxylesterase
MTVATSEGLSRVQSGEGDAILTPKNYKADGTVPGVIWLHGSGGSHLTAVDENAYPTERANARAIAERYPLLSIDAGGISTWGNDTAVARITTAKAYLQGAVGAKAGQIILAGQSMGGQNALVWAAQNLASVAAVFLVFPVCNLSDIVTNNRQGAAAVINSAYSGGWSEATYGAVHNPATLSTSGALNGLRAQMWMSDASDTIVLQATQLALAAAIGATCETHQMVGGHAEATAGNVDQAAVLAWLNTYAPAP